MAVLSVGGVDGVKQARVPSEDTAIYNLQTQLNDMKERNLTTGFEELYLIYANFQKMEFSFIYLKIL